MTPNEHALLLELEALVAKVAKLTKALAPPLSEEICPQCGRPIRPRPRTSTERVRAHRAGKRAQQVVLRRAAARAAKAATVE
jgi:hypothetical protein